MKLNVTVEITGLDTLRPSDIRNLPKDLQQTLQKMPQAEHFNKSIMRIDGFPPKLIDNKAISRYFPMVVPRTFQEALVLLRDCDNLYMARSNLRIHWSRNSKVFLLENGDYWTPGIDVILSEEKEWYVYSKDQPDQESPEFPNV